MITKESALNELHADTCVKVYDPSIKKVIAVFSNCKRASYRLGIPATTLVTKATEKKRVYSPLLNKEIAVRFAALKQGDQDLIKKTKYYQTL